jgi:hypothetical protein
MADRMVGFLLAAAGPARHPIRRKPAAGIDDLRHHGNSGSATA